VGIAALTPTIRPACKKRRRDAATLTADAFLASDKWFPLPAGSGIIGDPWELGVAHGLRWGRAGVLTCLKPNPCPAPRIRWWRKTQPIGYYSGF